MPSEDGYQWTAQEMIDAYKEFYEWRDNLPPDAHVAPWLMVNINNSMASIAAILNYHYGNFPDSNPIEATSRVIQFGMQLIMFAQEKGYTTTTSHSEIKTDIPDVFKDFFNKKED